MKWNRKITEITDVTRINSCIILHFFAFLLYASHWFLPFADAEKTIFMDKVVKALVTFVNVFYLSK